MALNSFHISLHNYDLGLQHNCYIASYWFVEVLRHVAENTSVSYHTCFVFTLHFERPRCFAFPENGSSWQKYDQPTGDYFTTDPVLLNMLYLTSVTCK